MIQMKHAETEAEIAACMALRWEIFVLEQGVPEEDELDGTDVGAVHVMALEDAGVIGVARYHLSERTAKIGRVCVARSERGRGIGADLIRFIERQVARKADRIRLGAQLEAQDFFTRLGYVPDGASYLDADIPHQDMEKQIT